MKFITGPLASIETWQVSIGDEYGLIICLCCWGLVGAFSPKVEKVQVLNLKISSKTFTFYPEELQKAAILCPHCGSSDIAKLIPMSNKYSDKKTKRR